MFIYRSYLGLSCIGAGSSIAGSGSKKADGSGCNAAQEAEPEISMQEPMWAKVRMGRHDYHGG